MEALNQSENDSTKDEEVIDPITITVNAGTSLSAPESALIARKRKVPINKGKNKQRGSAKTTNVSTWDRLKEYLNQHFAVVKGKLRGNCGEFNSIKCGRNATVDSYVALVPHLIHTTHYTSDCASYVSRKCSKSLPFLP